MPTLNDCMAAAKRKWKRHDFIKISTVSDGDVSEHYSIEITVTDRKQKSRFMQFSARSKKRLLRKIKESEFMQ